MTKRSRLRPWLTRLIPTLRHFGSCLLRPLSMGIMQKSTGLIWDAGEQHPIVACILMGRCDLDHWYLHEDSAGS